MSARCWPLGAGRIVTSRFGARPEGYHWGVDFGRDGGSAGMPVYAAQAGTVVYAGAATGFGGPDPAGWLVIDHPDEAGAGTTVYGHIVREVGPGARVTAGQRIGHINPSSATNGGVAPHLHFEVHRSVWAPPGAGRLDPLPWLSGAAEPGGDPVPETVYGIDVSNHQGNFDFAAAAREGFRFATHKITEGTWRDPYWPRARAEMAKHFGGRWGGYVFCKVGTHPEAEADALLAHAGGTDFPLQIDYEDLEMAGSIGDLHARIGAYTARGFRLLPIYLPRWYWASRMGSADLSGLPVGIWNSDYVGSGGYASALYPGDGYKGWAPMGGKAVEILQFTEGAVVAGQRIDANAIRGGEDRLAALFGGKDDDMTPEQERKLNVVYEELTKKFPSRSKYRADDNPVDTLAGLVLNIDGRVHEESVEREALKGTQWAVDLVKREAAKGDAGACALLAQIGDRK